MTADLPAGEDTAVAARLHALDDDDTSEHLPVYTAIAAELAARLDQPDEPGKPHPTADPRTGTAADRTAADGGARA